MGSNCLYGFETKPCDQSVNVVVQEIPTVKMPEDISTAISNLASISVLEKINSAHFLRFIVEKNYSVALEFATKKKMKYITTPGAPNTFMSYLHHLSDPEMTTAERSGLLKLYQNLGMMTRETTSYNFLGEHKLNALMQPLIVTSQHTIQVFDFFLDKLSRKHTDWTAGVPGGYTPLSILLSKVELADHEHKMRDERAMKLVAILPEHALNVVLCNGNTPISLAAQNGYVGTLEALIRKLPMVEFQPQHFLLPSRKNDTMPVVPGTNLMEASLKEKYSKKVNSLLAAGHEFLEDYYKRLNEILQKILFTYTQMPHDVYKIIWSF